MRRRFVALGAVTLAAIALRIAVACLPNLPPLGSSTLCGNGVVDLDAGETCDPGDAGATGCTSTCQIACEGGAVDDATSHCYFWAASQTELSGAVCGTAGHPIAFVDLSELQFVADATKNLPNAAGGASWVALVRDIQNEAGFFTYTVPFLVPQLPGWSASCAGCFGYTDASDFMLPASGNQQSCVDWKRSLTSPWVQAACALGLSDAGVPVTQSVLCEREPPGSFSWPCPDDASAERICIRVPVTRTSVAPYPYAKRYDLSPAGTFAVATNDCMNRGGKLVEFETAAEREEVTAEIIRAKLDRYWIGLFFNGATNQWQWVNGPVAAPPVPWADLEPDLDAGDAAAIVIQSGFTTNLAYATDPTITLPYVCEFPD